MEIKTKEKIMALVVTVGIIFAIYLTYLTITFTGSFHVSIGICAIIFMITMILIILHFIRTLINNHSASET